MNEATEKRKRRPRPRSADVILGCLDERLLTLDELAIVKQDASIGIQVLRMRVLTDELRRSINGSAREEPGEEV